MVVWGVGGSCRLQPEMATECACFTLVITNQTKTIWSAGYPHNLPLQYPTPGGKKKETAIVTAWIAELDELYGVNLDETPSYERGAETMDKSVRNGTLSGTSVSPILRLMAPKGHTKKFGYAQVQTVNIQYTRSC